MSSYFAKWCFSKICLSTLHTPGWSSFSWNTCFPSEHFHHMSHNLSPPLDRQADWQNKLTYHESLALCEFSRIKDSPYLLPHPSALTPNAACILPVSCRRCTLSRHLLVSCVLSETSLHFLKIIAQISTAAITSSLSRSPQQICCEWASDAALSVSGALTEHCQPFLSERGFFFFCLTSTYLLTFPWKASTGLWRSIVLVFFFWM